MKKLRICLVTSLFTGKGGTERALISLANNLSQCYDVSIISLFTDKGAMPQYTISSGVNVVHFDINQSNPLYRIWKIFKQLRRHLKEYDIAIGQVPFINVLLGFYKFLNFDKRIKVLATEHTSYFAVGKVSRYLSFWAYRYLDRVVCLTQKNEKEFNRRGIIKTEVVPNAIPMEYEKKTQQQVEPQNIILSVGRLSFEKNFVYLLHSLKDVLKKNLSWKLLIVGQQGNDTHNIYKAIDQLGLNRQVQIKSFTKDIAKEYLSASIYVLVSQYEGFPMVLVEAKSFGLPIVAHDCNTGPSEIIKHQTDGILIPYMDSDAFAYAVQSLIRDPNKRNKMRQQALENSKEFSSEAILMRWKNIFNSLN